MILQDTRVKPFVAAERDPTRSWRLWTLKAALIATATVAIPSPVNNYFRFSCPKFAVALLCGALLGLASTLRPSTVAFSRSDIAWTALFSIGIASMLIRAPNAWAAVDALTIFAVGLLFYRGAASLGRPSAPDLFATMLIASTIVALSSLAEAFSLLPRLSLPGRGPGGLLGNRNFAALFMVTCLPAAVFTVTRPAGTLIVALRTVALGMIGATILVTRCRTAWIAGLTVGAAALVWAACRARIQRPPRLRLSAAFPIGCAAALAAVVAAGTPKKLWNADRPYAETWSHLTDHQNGSGRAREFQARTSLQLAIRSPLLGVGPGNWSAAYPMAATLDDPNVPPRRHEMSRYPNGDWFGFAAEWGMGALALMLAIVVTLAVAACRRAIDGDAVSGVGALTIIAAGVAGMGEASLVRAEQLAALAVAVGVSCRPRAIYYLRKTSVVRIASALVVAAALAGALRQGRIVASQWFAASTDIGGLRQAWRLDPANHLVGARLAFALSKAGMCDEAREVMTRTYAIFPGSDAGPEVDRRCRVALGRLGNVAP